MELSDNSFQTYLLHSSFGFLSSLHLSRNVLSDRGPQYRHRDGRSHNDDVEDVPHLPEEGPDAEGVELEGDLEGEDGEEGVLAAVQVEGDEDGVGEDGEVEDVAEVLVLDQRDGAPGGRAAVQRREPRVENHAVPAKS